MIARPPVWVTELAGRFWADAGDPPPFPRDLRASACWLPDLTVQEVSGLTLARAAEAFRAAGIPCAATGAARRLHGCFGSSEGRGLILIDPDDDLNQLRFTFAHELAHFLRASARPVGPRSPGSAPRFSKSSTARVPRR